MVEFVLDEIVRQRKLHRWFPYVNINTETLQISKEAVRRIPPVVKDQFKMQL